jgi:hypothetical protein
MNNFFKMSLVAAAVAVSGTATAGTFTGNAVKAADVTANQNAVVFSTEGKALVSEAKQLAPTVSYKLGAAYITGDELTITFHTGAITLSDVSTAPAVAYTTDSVFPQTIIVDTANFDKVAVGTGFVRYRVISGTAVMGSSFVLPQEKMSKADITNASKNGVVFATANILTAKVFVRASATTNNGATPYDVDTTPVVDATNAGLASKLSIELTQFGTVTAVTPKFNSVIDGSFPANSESFIGEVSDSFAYTYKAPTSMPTIALLGKSDGVNDLTADANKVAQVLVLTASAGSNAAVDYTSAAGATPVKTSATVTTFNYPKGASIVNDTITATPKTGASAAAITAQTASLVITNANAIPAAAKAISTTLAAGAWTVQGSVVAHVPYMPYGTGLSQVIYANNTSSSNVEVSVVAKDESGTSYTLGVVATVPAGGVTKLATGIKNALAAQSFTEGKVSLDITFRGSSSVVAGSSCVTAANGTTPGDACAIAVSADGTEGLIAVTPATVKLHSGYNANASDRGFVTNSTNGAK